MMKNFKNLSNEWADFYLYGDIVDEKSIDWFTGEKSETEVDVNDVVEELKDLKKQGVKNLNIYINSAGGSVFASSTMVSLLKRFREENKGKIVSYIDGLCASASTYLFMMADESYIYRNSMMMIHKPMALAFGNVNEMKKTIDVLDKIENDMMIPLYESKAKVSKEEIGQLINDETWFTGNPDGDMYIGNYFNVLASNESKKVSACASPLLKNYKNYIAPQQEEIKEEIDYSTYDKILKTLGGKR